jgi:RHS repeat-associated protein
VGTVIERYKYDPYGKATILAPDGITTRTASIVNNPFMYCGYYHDAETGLDALTFRYYSTDLGRFISRDPIGYEGGINLYAYVNNRPTMYVDPMGLDDKPLPPRHNSGFNPDEEDAYIAELAKWKQGKIDALAKLKQDQQSFKDRCFEFTWTWELEETVSLKVINSLKLMGTTGGTPDSAVVWSLLNTLSTKISGGTIKIGGVIKGRTWCGRTEYLTEDVRVKITKVNDLTGSFRVDRTWINNLEGTGAGELQGEQTGLQFDWVWNTASSVL